jgi:hypothetical protein
MDLSKKLLTLLAIFCVIASAGVVCAADNGDNLGTVYADDMSGYAGSQYEDGGYAGSQYQDDGGWAGSQYEDGGYAGSQYQDDGGWAGSQYNASEENGGWAGSQYNETLENANATNTTHVAAAGEPTNATTNITANATSSQHMLATGNPILLLVGVCAVAGGYAVLRRKE